MAKILIVDNKPDARKFFGEGLACLGYTVIVTGETEKIPEMIRVENPDLILIDLPRCEPCLHLLPVIYRENARVPILIVTSCRGCRKDPRWSLAADLLGSGFFLDDLAQKVAELLETKPTVSYSASA